MRRPTVTVTLTDAEARALAIAAGNSIDDPTDAHNVLGHHNQVKAAIRAVEKLRAAIMKED